MSIKKRLFLAAVFLCIAVWAGFYLQSLHFGLHNFKDSAYYIILAEGLSRFQGLRALCYPGHPLSKYCAPLFPLMLSPILYFFGRNFVLMHGLVLLFSLLTLFFTYKYIENASATSFYGYLFLFFSAHIVIYIMGVGGLMFYFGWSIAKAVSIGVFPFLGEDILKVFAASAFTFIVIQRKL